MAIATPETVVLSELLSDLPKAPAVVQQAVAAPLLRALDLVPRAPSWVTDPDVIASILAGFIDIPDDIAGGA